MGSEASGDPGASVPTQNDTAEDNRIDQGYIDSYLVKDNGFFSV